MPDVTKTARAKKAAPTLEPLASHAVLYPGLGDVVTGVGRALSVIGGRSVRTTLVAVNRTTAARPRAEGGVVVAATPDAVVQFSTTTLAPLVEALMGLRARPATATTATSSQLRLLSTHLGPALRPVVAALSPNLAPAFALTAVTGAKAWAQLRAEHLDEVVIDVTVEDIRGRLSLLLPGVPSERPTANGAAAAAVATVPVPLTVSVPPTRVAAARLAALAPGQTLLLAVTTDAPWLLRAGPALVATGHLGRSQGRTALTIDTLRKETDMSTPAAPALPATPAEEVELGVVSDIEIDVTVQSGRVTMQVHQLASLREGAVVTLDRAPDAPVDVLANGRKVATAQVVDVEGQMALRILTVGH